MRRGRQEYRAVLAVDEECRASLRGRPNVSLECPRAGSIICAMPVPCSLCLEDLVEENPDQQFLRCVALPGRQPGLRLHADGSVGWKTSNAIACEVAVSRDQELLLFRPAGARSVRVCRGGRTLAVPSEKPVVLADGDEIFVAKRHFRVHIHGETTNIIAPTPLILGARVGSAVAMIAVSAAMLACDRPSDVKHDGSTTQSATSVPSASSPPEPGVSASAGASASAFPPPSDSVPRTKPSTSKPKRPPPKPRIEVRDKPPLAD